jgi:hypothetical protein
VKTEIFRRKRIEYHVQVRDRGGWIVIADFGETDYPEAYRTWESIRDPSACIVEVVTRTTVNETQVWPAEWTEERGLCHYNGFADHNWHVISLQRKQFCRGNGPFMAEPDWVPTDEEAAARDTW